MENFEEVLAQFEPMIYACLRKLRIYKNHDTFIQSGRIGLWQAWERYDSAKGDFAPFAYRSIHGSLLDELKKSSATEERYIPAEGHTLEILLNMPALEIEWSKMLTEAIAKLTMADRQLIQLLFIDGFSLDETALHLSLTKAALKKRRERILQKLRNILTKSTQ